MLKNIVLLIIGSLLLMTSPLRAEDQFDPSLTLGDLLFAALDHGVNSVREGGPLVPFVMAEAEGKLSLKRFVAEPYEKAVAEAKASVPNLPEQTNLYAIVYDGFVTVSGKKYDAIIVHGAERGKGEAYLLAQRYIPARSGEVLELVGNPAFIGREHDLFKDWP